MMTMMSLPFCNPLPPDSRFQAHYGDRALTALPYSMNSEFSKVLAGQMVSFPNHEHEIILL